MIPQLNSREQSFCVRTMVCLLDRMFVVEGFSTDAILLLASELNFHEFAIRGRCLFSFKSFDLVSQVLAPLNV